MNFSYNWLQDHFDTTLPTPNELGVSVGLHSFELEGTEEAPHGDTLIDWDVLPNRSSDALCYQGVAREIGAVLDIPYKQWSFAGVADATFDDSFKTSDFITLSVDDLGLVKRATKRLALDVQVGPSPTWLVERLEAIGQKSINNVVDITNYVMWETGQPVHAFDFDKLAGEQNTKQVDIRLATSDELVTDLTGAEHVLTSDMLVIADSEKALDIAGVKGGLGSGVDENTTRVMLSACSFDFQNIRNTARRLKLHTDASKRFENEVPLNKIDHAMQQFAYLMQELAGARVSSEIVDTNPGLPEQKPINVSVSTTNRILGLELARDEIVNKLERIGCIVSEGEEEFTVTPPFERLDMTFAGDAIEEIGRLYGYENLDAVLPSEGFVLPQISLLQKGMRAASDRLVALGFYEAKTRTLGASGTVELLNPLTKKAGLLRDHLVGDLLAKADKNLMHSDEPRLFEIGKIFTGITDGVIDEQWNFAGVIGKRKIKEKNKQDHFLQTKGVVESVCEAMGIIDLVFRADTTHDSVAKVMLGEVEIGCIGVNWWELNFSNMIKSVNHTVSYNKPSRFPKIDRDVAVFVPVEKTVKEVHNLISNLLPDETQSCELFDVFEKEDKKSFAFRMVFQSDTETLSDEWANNVMNPIYKALEKEGYEIR